MLEIISIVLGAISSVTGIVAIILITKLQKEIQ